MADNVQFTLNADSTPPNGTLAATDELSDGSHAGIAKLAISVDGDRTLIPATAADGLLVNLGANNDVTVTGTVAVTQPVSVDDNGGSLTVDAPVATPVNVQVGDGTDTALVTAAGELNVISTAQPGVDIGDVTINNGAGAAAVNIQDGGNTITVDGTVGVSGTVAVQQNRAATGTLTTVADNAASVTILASNANRLKALITNDSSARLYLRFEAAAASTSNYGVSLAQYETWEELTYTGEIRGIWQTDPGDGAARVTEFT